MWLWSICAMVTLMVVVGGVTRLTHSGLSIVEWQPIRGVIPPMSQAAWQAMFLKYQQFPEYKLLNHGMSLSEFKLIFFWEYIHRLIGRLIGFVVFVPWFVFVIQKSIPKSLAWKLIGGFLLGGLQGVMGWYMVKSGLVNNPRVSHYRLAAHLLLALGVLVYFFWIILDLIRGAASAKNQAIKKLAPVRYLNLCVIGIVLLQITYGAFTAGLRAGFGFNTFPKMNGEWIPTGLIHPELGWLSLLEGHMGVQFTHRTIGWLLLLVITAFWIYGRRFALNSVQRRGLNFLFGMIIVQFLLGVWTLVGIVPISVAVAHQFGAVILLMIAVSLFHSLKRPVTDSSR